jgi:16S rRNA (guanine527-N7)-methyltransferase
MTTELPPRAAAAVFGARLPLATGYAAELVGSGVERGLIGPRETSRLWSRHLLNCAVMSELLPPGVRVVDVGSGAGLPGIALACARPDVHVDLVEPMERRLAFLVETIATLGLDAQVTAIRGRAEEETVRRQVGRVEWVTARAVAPLDRLARWCLPLLTAGGSLLAIKGRTAHVELDEHRAVLRRLGAGTMRVTRCGVGVLEEPTTVVEVQRA